MRQYRERLFSLHTIHLARSCFIVMVYSKKDLATIESCFLEKGWRGKKICNEFPGKRWNYRSVNCAIRKIIKTGCSDRVSGSGRPRTARTDENVDNVEQMILSQEDMPGTHKSQRAIARQIGISRRSVQRISKDIGLKSVKRLHTPQVPATSIESRVHRSKQLLRN